MTREQIQDEKLDVQKALLQYESLHGRPVSVCVHVRVCVTAERELTLETGECVCVYVRACVRYCSMRDYTGDR